MNRFLCIHGHFYQPPRENPRTGLVDRQESAAPYHDWNERITAECYAQNAVTSMPEPDGSFRRVRSNYSRISFNFGPTLLAWLDERAPAVYDAILAADRESRARFSGHGSALAQAYNHMILPLANSRDKRTQVLWGIRDFEHRFGRSPEGMWLPETAVDCETLEVLADLSIRFTILSPYQAFRWKPLGEDSWRDARGGRIDGRRPYEALLPSGRRIVLFFYDGAASHAVAFGELERGGESLGRRLTSLFSETDAAPQLVHIATDGETYGHHHRGGDRVLADALDWVERSGAARLINYGEYLAEHPPAGEVEILENTAWSCVHGLGRWKEDCSCRTGLQPEWTQAWRGPLRDALDGLRDRLGGVFEAKGSELFSDPWEARDSYIAAILDPSPAVFEQILGRHARANLDAAQRKMARPLLEMQRSAMLMYTSCGWFFDDPSGLETTQILRYAARAIELAEGIAPVRLEPDFLQALETAASNDPQAVDARRIYESAVLPFRPPRERPDLLAAGS